MGAAEEERVDPGGGREREDELGHGQAVEAVDLELGDAIDALDDVLDVEDRDDGAGGLVHAWPANPGENQYTSVPNSNVPTLLIGGTLDFEMSPTPVKDDGPDLGFLTGLRGGLEATPLRHLSVTGSYHLSWIAFENDPERCARRLARRSIRQRPAPISPTARSAAGSR